MTPREGKWLTIHSPLQWLGLSPSPRVVKLVSGVMALLILVGSWGFVLMEEGGLGFLTAENLNRGVEFIQRLAGAGVEHPAFLNPARWTNALELSLQTLQMSVLAIGLAGLMVLLTILPGARNAADGTLTLQSTLPGRIAFYVIRGVYIFSRGVPELFWAMLILFLMEPGILPGAIALAIHNYGILGKLCSEIVEDLDPDSIRALRSSGAGRTQMLLFGIFPQVIPNFLTYLLYRWEDVIRTTIVVGFVSLGGLGREFQLRMSYFHYDEIALLLFCYFVLVVLVELVSAGLRWLAKL